MFTNRAVATQRRNRSGAHPWPSSTIAAVSFVLLAAACGDGIDDPHGKPPGTPASITITGGTQSPLRSRGDTLVLVAVSRDANGRVVEVPLEWTSSEPTVATVNSDGSTAPVIALRDGTTMISVSSGGVIARAPVTVQRSLAAVHVSVPQAELVYGERMAVTATARDARGFVIEGATGFTFATSNPVSMPIATDGTVTALFQVPQQREAVLSATLTRDGVTASGSANASVRAPSGFDRAAVMLSDFVWPTRVPNIAAGVAFFTRRGGNVDYRITWSAMSGSATHIQIRGPASETALGALLFEAAPPTADGSFGAVVGTLNAADIRAVDGRSPISLDSLTSLMCTRQAYVEIRSAAFPLGEMRGQIQCTP